MYSKNQEIQHKRLLDLYQSVLNVAKKDLPLIFDLQSKSFLFLFNYHVASNQPLKNRYNKHFWLPKLGAGEYLRPAMERLLAIICDYQTTRNIRGYFRRGKPADPTNLMFEELKDWCVKFSRGSREDIKKFCEPRGELERRVLYLKSLEYSDIFPESKYSKVTTILTLFQIRTELNSLQRRLNLYLSNACARDQIQISLTHAKQTLRYGVSILYYLLRDGKNIPQDCSIEGLRNMGNKLVLKSMDEDIAKPIRQLLQSPVLQRLFPMYSKQQPLTEIAKQEQNNNDKQLIEKDNTSIIEGQSNWENLNAILELLVNKKKTGLSNLFKHEKRRAIVKDYLSLHGMLEELGRFILLLKYLHNLAGKGGDLMIYGLVNKPVQQLMQSFMNALSVIQEGFRFLHVKLERIYGLALQRNENNTWVENFRKADMYHNYFQNSSKDCYSSLAEIQQHAKHGISAKELRSIENDLKTFLKSSKALNKRWNGASGSTIRALTNAMPFDRPIAITEKQDIILNKFSGYEMATNQDKQMSGSDNNVLSFKNKEEFSEAKDVSEEFADDFVAELKISNPNLRRLDSNKLNKIKQIYNKFKSNKSLASTKQIVGRLQQDQQNYPCTEKGEKQFEKWLQEEQFVSLQWNPLLAAIIKAFGSELQNNIYNQRWLFCYLSDEGGIKFGESCSEAASHAKDCKSLLGFYGAKNSDKNLIVNAIELYLLSILAKMQNNKVIKHTSPIALISKYLADKDFIVEFRAEHLPAMLQKVIQGIRQHNVEKTTIKLLTLGLSEQKYSDVYSDLASSFNKYKEKFENKLMNEGENTVEIEVPGDLNRWLDALQDILNNLSSEKQLYMLEYMSKQEKTKHSKAWQEVMNKLMHKSLDYAPILFCLLVSLGANPQCQNARGFTLLHEVAMRGNLKLLQWLHKFYGCDLQTTSTDNSSLLHSAVVGAKTDTVKWLVEQNPESLNVKTTKGWTCLHGLGNVEIVKYLLVKKPELINVQDKESCTALQKALAGVRPRHTKETILALIKAPGINLKWQDEYGKDSYLHYCVKYKRIDMMRELIIAAPELLQLKNKHGNTSLETAKAYNFDNIVLLLEKYEQEVKKDSKRLLF